MLKTLCIFALTLASLPSLALTQLTGTVKNTDGSNFYGKIVLSLPFAGATDTSGNVVNPGPISYPVSNGNILSTNPTIIANGDIAAPQGTYYVAALYNSFGEMTETFNLVIPSGSTFNIGSAAQTAITTPNVSFVNPAGLASNNVWTGNNTFTQISTFNGTSVFNGLVQLNGGVTGVSGFLVSFNGRTTPAAVPATGDYTVAQVTGAAPLASPAFTGAPTAPTPATADNTTKLATTAYVQANLTAHTLAQIEFNSCTMASTGGGSAATCSATQAWGTTLPNSSYKLYCQLSCPGLPGGSCNATGNGYQGEIFWSAKTTTNFNYILYGDHSGDIGSAYVVDCQASQ